MLNCVDIIDIGHCCTAPMHRDHAVPLAIFSGTDTQDDYGDYDKEHYSPNGRTNVCTHTETINKIIVNHFENSHVFLKNMSCNFLVRNF